MPRSKEGFLWTPTQETEGLQTDAVQQGSRSIEDHYDVIVIGAGFAGLIAARDLTQKHGLRVLLVDARDRIGGRTWTAKVLGEEIEMGGTWVHWNQPHLYAELHRYGLHRNLKTSAELVPADKYVTVLESVAQRFFSIDGLDSRSLMPYPHDPLRQPSPWQAYDHLSVKDRLNQLHDIPQWEKELFESNINTFGSAPGKDIGFVEALRWFTLGGHSMAGVFELAGIFKLGKGGMTSFARAVWSEFTGDSLFNTPISGIRQGTAGVEVKTSHGQTLRAKLAVSTIPLNCLNDVQFSPPLSPLRQAAIAEGHINSGAKIHFKLRETLPGWFWTSNGYNGSDFVFAFSDHNGNQPSGPSGTWCIGFGYNGCLTDEKDSRSILKAFNQDINPHHTVEAYATHYWINDPYAKGVWACWGPKSTSKYLKALQESHGRIVFASADWAAGWRGFVDGAIERGQVAVQDIMQLLKNDLSDASAKL
ncbi:hypothetical protein TCE0_017f04047 [Talaromyces pinophilus]|uniref:Amine oxidase n=1 Tax=Talaromyces pinophilus TaxID=128442 RepID=A0A6V8H2V9_TALPI|nr:hypothetical protein TCE0_017f04047 [Talaromyces pinophilus]